MNKRIFGLDLMRAAAILCVIFSHALWNFPEYEGPVVSIIELLGVTGVELFFVLSGFLIGRILFRIYTDSTFSMNDFKYFLVRRWFRTLPNYYLILMINILIVIFIGRALPDDLPSYFLFFQNVFHRMPVFFTESWSLPIEEFTYVLVPLALYFVFLIFPKSKRKSLFLGITIGILVFFFGTKLYYNFTTENNDMIIWNRDLKAVVIYRIDAIVYGVMAAWVSLNLPMQWERYKILALRIGIILFLVLQSIVPILNVRIEEYPFYWNVLYLPLVSVSIMCLLPWLTKVQIHSNYVLKPVTFISKISYSMYLLHYSIVLQLMRYFIPIEDISFGVRIIYSMLYVLFTVILAYWIYRFYEKPLMDLRESRTVLKLFGKLIN